MSRQRAWELAQESRPGGPGDDSCERLELLIEATVADALSLWETYAELHVLPSDRVEQLAREHAEKTFHNDNPPPLRDWLRAAAEESP